MQLHGETDDLGFCLSFSCYFSDSLTASAAAKVIRELKQEPASDQFYEFSDIVDEEDFEFSLHISDQKVVLSSGKHEIDDLQHRQFIFPVSDDCAVLDDCKAVEEFYDAASSSSSVSIGQLQKHSCVDEQELYSSSSFSSSEADENTECNCKPSGIFCSWMSKADVATSVLKKREKSSSSTGNSGSRGSKRWRIWNSTRRGSNSQGEEESIFFLRSKKTEASKYTEEVAKVAGKLKTRGSGASPSFHERFYVQKRAEQKGDKMKSFLPYKQDLLGFFVSINRSGNRKLSI